MKKNNKGFSLVELIIVIAIMAILAGALAPALIKYIAKSRRSTDIQNADSFRTAIQTALSNPDAADAVSAAANPAGVTTVGTISGYKIPSADIKTNKDSNKFCGEVYSVIGDTKLTTKYKAKGDNMYAIVNMDTNTVAVFSGGSSADKDKQLSPSTTGAWATN